MRSEGLVDTNRAERLTGLAPTTIRKHARRGRLPAVRRGKLWFFRISDLEIFKYNIKGRTRITVKQRQGGMPARSELANNCILPASPKTPSQSLGSLSNVQVSQVPAQMKPTALALFSESKL